MSNYYSDLTVNQLIEKAISSSPKSRVEIAKTLGFKNPTIVSMIKNGATILPISKVAKFAKLMDLDPLEFYLKYLEEIKPEQYQDLMVAINYSESKSFPISETEAEFLKFARKNGIDLRKVMSECSNGFSEDEISVDKMP